MYTNKNWLKSTVLGLAIFMGLLLISSSMVQARWTALPPYNTLWPLWSSPLSPTDSLTRVVLPVQPGLTWDKGKTYLYVTPFPYLMISPDGSQEGVILDYPYYTYGSPSFYSTWSLLNGATYGL